MNPTRHFIDPQPISDGPLLRASSDHSSTTFSREGGLNGLPLRVFLCTFFFVQAQPSKGVRSF